jgi:outer membrane autotransporter protein
LNQTSVQSSLGVQASVGFETTYGIVVPQAAVAWVHEYANSDRNIDARLVEAPAAPSFTFQREPPARDWASIGLGVSAVLLNGLQPFVQFATIQGNENFVSYGGMAGVRLGL